MFTIYYNTNDKEIINLHVKLYLLTNVMRIVKKLSENFDLCLMNSGVLQLIIKNGNYGYMHITLGSEPDGIISKISYTV